MRPPPWLGSGTNGRDFTLAGASLFGGLVLWSLGWQPQIRPYPDVPPALFLPPLLAMCVAVSLRRIAPRASLAVGTGALVVDIALGGSLGTLLIYTQVLYDACVYGPSRLWRWLLRVTIALSVVGAVVGVIVLDQWRGVAVGVPVVLAGLLPVLTGVSVRQYRDQAAAERARAEQTARLVELDRRQAVSAERARMARELHDVVANHLSAVAIHATAVLSVPGLERGQVESALRVIRESSVQGLAEMRQMIEVLREPGAGGERPPVGGPLPEAVTARLAEADRLVERIRAAGLVVRVRTDGTPGPLPVGVDLAAYRIVQESLTNALKHGTGEAELTIAYRPAEVVLTVENPVRPSGAGVPGAGAGLIGMRERATLLAGRFTAGPQDGHWQVRAALPTGVAG
ncbi:sensor histidine kinase [Micromonospora sp. NPDC000316]|uniref:sensor histidine kinase n=1 Tax=Micromonospora sp. NPDC000316 TaxID=3364216 RepID=UPI0036B21F54